MPENETRTVGDRMRTGEGKGIATARDTIKGWNNRRQSNNQIISSMVPFVQLIGLFDEEEYKKLFKLGTEDRVEVVYSDDEKSKPYNERKLLGKQKSWAEIEKDLEHRFINLYMVRSVDHGLNVASINGIIMAEKVSQVQDPSGGIGITDLQVDYGKSNVLGARKFTMRLTINDPKILDTKFEYSKLATFGSQFLLLYGWSNPEVIPGYDAAMSPPKLEGDPTTGNPPTRDRLIVPLRNLGNGGYWSAARVNISEYQFGFNEMGKLEISVVFRDESTLGMSSTTISSVAKKFKSFLADGTLDRIITGTNGQEFTLRNALYARQLELNKQYREIAAANAENAEARSRGALRPRDTQTTDEAYAELVSNWDSIPATLTQIIDPEGKLFDLTVDDAAPKSGHEPYQTEASVNERVTASRQPVLGYPPENSINIWTQKFTRVVDDDPEAGTGDEEDEAADNQADGSSADAVASTDVPTKAIVDYEKKPAYYFLGAIMDSISLCMADTSLGISAPKVPSFFYRDISSDSKLNTAFQSKIKSQNSNTTLEDKIQEGVIRLKERFLPPGPRKHERIGRNARSGDQYWRAWEAALDRVGIGPFASPEDGTSVVGGTQPVYEGEQTEQKTRVIRALFPAPAMIGQMAGAPMRGHFTLIDTDVPAYAAILSEKGLPGVGPLWCFIPDWKQETNFDPEGNELISSGSPDGFDPLNPSEYRSADQSEDPNLQTSTAAAADDATAAALAVIRARDEAAGEDADIIEESSTFERTTVRPSGVGGFPVVPERSQEPYGRGGKFFMIMTFTSSFQSIVGTTVAARPIKVILDYDTWRLVNKETWNLLQLKWHNLYREYLAAYFERVIRLRVIETQAIGMPLESLYNEVVDLDWMTGIIYDNNYWEGGERAAVSQKNVNNSWIKTWAEVGNSYAKDFDIAAAENKLNQDVAKFDEIIKEQTATIEGKRQELNYDYTSEGASVVDYYGLRGAVRRLVDKINKIKLEIEQLTGGFYERDNEGNIDTEDVMGNPIMMRFKSFEKVVPSKTEYTEGGVLYEYPQEIPEWLERKGGQALAARIANPIMIGVNVFVYKTEIEYGYKVEIPAVKEEWILWNDHQVPTNNFQNQFDTRTRDWVENDRPNKAQRWKQLNVHVYNNSVLPKLEADKKAVSAKLNTIRQYQNELNEFYDDYQEANLAITNATTKIEDMKRVFAGYTEFFNQGRLELSPYDDTSALDGDGLFIPMGRDEPMHLTTKVAQQWAGRFSGVLRRGVIDVRNYGPPLGGKEYTLPTNLYKFKFDSTRKAWGVIGVPKRVLDPEVFQRIDPDTSSRSRSKEIQNIAGQMLGNLSYSVDKDSTAGNVLSKNMNYEVIHIGRETKTGYQNWSLFGTPGIPNDFGNNQWGFSYGPPIEKDLGGGNFEIVGGNYVRTYRDFLNLFDKGYNPEWPENYRIVGPWPMPKDNPDGSGDDDADLLMEEGSANIPIYTLIDEGGSLLVPNGDGWYKPSGWHLDFEGDPIFLYPSRATACKINNTSKYVDNVRPGGVLKRGLPHGGWRGSTTPGTWDRQQTAETGPEDGANWSPNNSFRQRRGFGGEYTGRSRSVGQALQDHFSDVAKGAWAAVSALFEGDFVKFAKLQYKFYAQLTGPGMIAEHRYKKYMAAKRGEAMKKLNDGDPVDYFGNKPAWGGRIGIGEHCPNLTLDMKRSLIIWRQTVEDRTRFLGYDMAAGGGYGPVNKKIDWNALEKVGAFYVHKNDHNIRAQYSGTKTVDGKTVPVGSVQGPLVSDADNPEGVANATYSNTEYPYGTGFYREPRNSDGETYTQHGPYVFPEKAKNWVDWGDLLQQLPGYGFFTQVDNSNYTSCMVQPNGSITDGVELNEGFVKFLIENVFAPLPKNRRIACASDHTKIKILGSNSNEVDGYHDAERLNDVTYGDILGPLRDPSEDDEAPAEESILASPAFGNMDNFSIDNVKNIPIRAELIDNLVNKNNTNMSITQFLGEILRPAAIGVNNVGNTRPAIRQGDEGVFEVFCPTAINWSKEWENHEYLFNKPLSPADAAKRRYPDDIMVLDFKASDSLIENLDMNSTFDPIVARAFKDAAVNYTGSTDNFLEFLSHKDMAQDLAKFLETNEAVIDGKQLQPAEEGLDKAITVGVDGAVSINKSMLFETNSDGAATVRAGVQNSIQKFLQADPKRLNALRALDQAKDSDNYATTLLANYMRKTTITIHGTTNISPFQTIIVKGIMPKLEGMYLITNTRESITPQGFQTILEGSLINPPSANARLAKDEHGELVDVVPQESTQPHVDQASAAEPPAADVEEASELEDSPPQVVTYGSYFYTPPAEKVEVAPQVVAEDVVVPTGSTGRPVQ